jgi:hypothetical protein
MIYPDEVYFDDKDLAAFQWWWFRRHPVQCTRAFLNDMRRRFVRLITPLTEEEKVRERHLTRWLMQRLGRRLVVEQLLTHDYSARAGESTDTIVIGEKPLVSLRAYQQVGSMYAKHVQERRLGGVGHGAFDDEDDMAGNGG